MRINIDKLGFTIRSLGINCGIRRHIESVTERSGYPERGEMLKKSVIADFGSSLRRTPREIN